MKNSEIRALSTADLKKKIEEFAAQVEKLKFDHAVSPLKNPKQIREVRRIVAQMHTELHSRTLGALSEQVKKGELTQFNAREVLKGGKFDSNVKLATLKKVISRNAK